MIKHSKQLAWWQHPDTREVYVLVGIDKNTNIVNSMSSGKVKARSKIAHNIELDNVQTEEISMNIREVK